MEEEIEFPKREVDPVPRVGEVRGVPVVGGAKI